MASWHLSELRIALKDSGWTIDDEFVGDDVAISARWRIRRINNEYSVILEFEGMDDLGVLTIDKAYGVRVMDSALDALYLPKRKPRTSRPNAMDKWRVELSCFIDSLPTG